MADRGVRGDPRDLRGHHYVSGENWLPEVLGPKTGAEEREARGTAIDRPGRVGASLTRHPVVVLGLALGLGYLLLRASGERSGAGNRRGR